MLTEVPPPKAFVVEPKPLVVPVPLAPNNVFCWLLPKALVVLLLLLPNPLKPPVVVAPPPNAGVVLLLLPNPLLLPKPVGWLFVVLPNKPPVLFVLAPKPVVAGLLKRDPEPVLLLPKPVDNRVSRGSGVFLGLFDAWIEFSRESFLFTPVRQKSILCR